jgi:tetratricopeptide (TPR) repeat protein
VLLVVDNLPSPGEGGAAMVERLTAGLPRRFRCLFTQRALPTDDTDDLKLPVFDHEDGLELLKIRSGAEGRRRIEQEPEAAERLVDAVDGLPLALVLLAGRLRRVPTLRVSELLEELLRHALRTGAFQEKSAKALAEPGIEATLRTSWDPLGSEAMELARLLSLTLPAPIPWELIERCAPYGHPTTPQPVNRHWEDALAELVGANLLDALDGDHPLYGLHPLVRQFFSLQRRGWDREPIVRKELAEAARYLAERYKGVTFFREAEYLQQACAADPTDVKAALDLGIILMGIGDARGALEAFEVILANSEELARKNPEYAEWKADLRVNHELFGYKLLNHEFPFALKAYEAGLEFAEGMAKDNIANMQWQLDLSISHEKIGNMHFMRGDEPKAMVAYRDALSIREALARHDPENIEWLHHLSVSHDRIGDLQIANNNRPEALAAFKASYRIREDLAKRELTNARWQLDVAVSCAKLGTMDALMPVSTRRAYLQRGLNILLDLEQAGRLYANQDYTAFFEGEIRKLDSSD